jgi:hypothetical protein
MGQAGSGGDQKEWVRKAGQGGLGERSHGTQVGTGRGEQWCSRDPVRVGRGPSGLRCTAPVELRD